KHNPQIIGQHHVTTIQVPDQARQLSEETPNHEPTMSPQNNKILDSCDHSSDKLRMIAVHEMTKQLTTNVQQDGHESDGLIHASHLVAEKEPFIPKDNIILNKV